MMRFTRGTLRVLIILVVSVTAASAGCVGTSEAVGSELNSVDSMLFLPAIFNRSVGAPADCTYFVAPDGDDATNDGLSIDQPFESISKGLQTVKAGEVVCVRDGVYIEKIVISESGTNSNNTVTVKSYPGEHPVIDGDDLLPTGNLCDARWAALVTVRGSYVVFDGFEIRNSRGRGVVIDDGEHVVLRNLDVHHVMGTGIHAQGQYSTVEQSSIWQTVRLNSPEFKGTCPGWDAGLVAVNVDHHVFRQNSVYNNFGEGLTVLRAADVIVEDNVVFDNFAVQLYIDHGTDVLVQRNLIYSSSDKRYWRKEEIPGPGLAISDEPYPGSPSPGRRRTIINNIIVGNSINIDFWTMISGAGLVDDVIANNTVVEAQGSGPSGSIGLNIESGNHSNTKIFNNIFIQSNGTLVYVPNDPGLDFSRNMWSKTVSPSAASPDDLVGDPELVNPVPPTDAAEMVVSWYKLKSSSPAIDQAIVSAGVLDDFFSNSRSQTPDIGAHEYGDIGSSSPTPPTTVSLTITPHINSIAHFLACEPPTPSPSATGEEAPGDVNLDGLINVLDVQLSINVILGHETDAGLVSRSDVNIDGEVNVLYAQQIVNIALAG